MIVEMLGKFIFTLLAGILLWVMSRKVVTGAVQSSALLKKQLNLQDNEKRIKRGLVILRGTALFLFYICILQLVSIYKVIVNH